MPIYFRGDSQVVLKLIEDGGGGGLGDCSDPGHPGRKGGGSRVPSPSPIRTSVGLHYRPADRHYVDTGATSQVARPTEAP